MTFLWPVGAIFRRDLRLAFTYRLNVVLTAASTLFGVALWYFFAGAVAPVKAGWAQGGYFGYLVTGTALMGLVNVSLHGFGRKLREHQITGTLEVLLGCPSPPHLILFASILWDLAAQALQVAFTVSVALLFGLKLSVGSLPALVFLLVLTLSVFAALGITAASILLVFQRGEPVTPFVGGLFALLGGVFFSPAVLPAPLAALARLLPLPYALSAMRGLLLQGWSWTAAWPDLLALLVFAAILLPLSFASLPLCLALARKYGLLSTY